MRPRRAYTLMELLLVLAIIVIAAAAVAPSFRGVMRNAALRSAADTVRAELTKSHVQAMRTGRIQVFQYELGGTKYKLDQYIGADDVLESPDGDPNSASAMPPPQPQTSADEQLQPGERMLAEGIKFTAGDAAVESRGERVAMEVSSSGGVGGTWSRPILFYPDGSSVDAFIVIGNDRKVGIRVDLRGMTGAVRVGPIADLQELETAQPISQ